MLFVACRFLGWGMWVAFCAARRGFGSCLLVSSFVLLRLCSFDTLVNVYAHIHINIGV